MSTELRVGAKLANFGPSAPRVLELATGLEETGVDSVWLADRIVTTDPLASVYPFTDDGRAPWTDDTLFMEALTTMAMVAARTSRLEIGVGVLVLPLRSPLVVAKQLSTVDALSGGRVALGIGAGWMAEEYAALNVPFDDRGARTDEAIDVLRACWQGEAGPVDGRYHRIPAGVRMHPRPAHHIPILAGGMTPAALRRAARCDGWFGFVRIERLEIDDIRTAMDIVGTGKRGVLRLVGPAEESARVAGQLFAAGISDLVIDVDPDSSDAAAQVERVRDAASHVPAATS